MSDEIDNLVQLNRDKFQSSTLNYSTKPNQTKPNKWVSFDIFIHLIDALFDCFTFFEFSLIEIELSFRFKSQLCFSNLLINCDNSPTHNWLNNQSNMSCMNLNLIYSKQTIVWLKGSVWFWFWIEKTDLMIDWLFIDWLKVNVKWLSKSHNQLIKLFCRSSKLLWILQIGLFCCLFPIDSIHLLTSVNLIESLKWLEQFWDSLICWLTFDLLLLLTNAESFNELTELSWTSW